jgi:hypothetical protein
VTVFLATIHASTSYQVKSTSSVHDVQLAYSAYRRKGIDGGSKWVEYMCRAWVVAVVGRGQSVEAVESMLSRAGASNLRAVSSTWSGLCCGFVDVLRASLSLLEMASG